MKFELTPEQYTRAMKWVAEEVYPEMVTNQKETIKDPTPIHIACWEAGYPYEGAIGGGITYEFTPTSLGMVEKVKYTTYSKVYELDLTEYSDW